MPVAAPNGSTTIVYVPPPKTTSNVFPSGPAVPKPIWLPGVVVVPWYTVSETLWVWPAAAGMFVVTVSVWVPAEVVDVSFPFWPGTVVVKLFEPVASAGTL